jgi:hypothetical protein
MQRKILVLNDMHIGSSYGILPPNFTDVAGDLHTQNVGQKYLWDRFIATMYRLKPQKIDAIVINGDLLDGMQPKSKGAPLTLHRLEDQREAAYKVLEEVRNAFPKAEWYFVEGTPYHEAGEQVQQIARNLLGMEARDVRRTLTLKVGKAVIRFHHETSYTSSLIKSGSIEKELIHSWLSEAMNDWEKVHCEVRAHCHYFCYVGRKDRLGIIAPCWQLQTDFITKNSPTKNIPDIGCIVLNVDDSLLEFGTCPVSFTEYLYKHPGPDIVDISEEEPENGETLPSVAE